MKNIALQLLLLTSLLLPAGISNAQKWVGPAGVAKWKR